MPKERMLLAKPDQTAIKFVRGQKKHTEKQRQQGGRLEEEEQTGLDK